MADAITPEEFAVLAGRVAALDGKGPIVVPPDQAARDRAAARGVDIVVIQGTGPGRQVTAKDVDDYADKNARATSTDPTATNPAPVDTPAATPAAVAHAEELGVPLEQVEGTGAGGTITKADVQAAAPAPEA